MTVTRSLIKPGQTEGELAYWDDTEKRWEGGGGLSGNDFVQKSGDTMTGPLVIDTTTIPDDPVLTVAAPGSSGRSTVLRDNDLTLTKVDLLIDSYDTFTNTVDPVMHIWGRGADPQIFKTLHLSTDNGILLVGGPDTGGVAFEVDTDGMFHNGYIQSNDAITAKDFKLGINSILPTSLNFVIDGGGSVITPGIKGDLSIPFKGKLSAVRLLGDQSGSMNLDLWKSTYAAYPPLVANTIVAAAPPRLTNAAKSEDLTLTGWTTTVAAGDVIRLNVVSAALVTRVTVALTLVRTS